MLKNRFGLDEGNRFPDFFVIGAAKSGTTALWNYFQKNSKIFVTTKIEFKELGYFSDYYGISDENEYLNHFSDARSNQLIGEVCHSYISSPESAKKIYDKIPNAKIIAVLRNPVERAYSLYNWMVMHGYENANSFEKALKLEIDRSTQENFKLNNPQGFYQNYMYISSGMYHQQLKRYYMLFNKENIKIVLYDDFIKNQKKNLLEINHFLGVNEKMFFQKESINVSKRVMFPRLFFNLKMKIRNYPNAKLNGVRKVLLMMIVRNEPPKKMSKKTNEYLNVMFSKDVIELSKLLNINLTKKWLNE